MLNYLIRRLVLLPITLFCIILVNFIIINLAPGDPVTITEISNEGGASRRDDRSLAFGSDERYLHFRERYGLTLPILFNDWPFMTQKEVFENLNILTNQKPSPQKNSKLTLKEYDRLRVLTGDQARFVMPQLLNIMTDQNHPLDIRRMAIHFFIRGATQQAILGQNLTDEQNHYNNKISKDNTLLSTLRPLKSENALKTDEKIASLKKWFDENKKFYRYQPTFESKIHILFFETRFYRYMSRVLTLDFGTLRNDSNKTVTHEVAKRFKYSLTLAILPMVITFFLCQFFAFLMALNWQRWPDHLLNLIFLILYAIPIFVVGPFLIEKALDHTFPFTSIPIPISGFSSPDAIYDNETSLQRLYDILQHLALPIIAVAYSSLAAQTRLSRTALLEVLRQDYVRTAWAKGVSLPILLVKHVGRNAAITIVTSLAGSLGVVLGGSLIVETLFDINGFGKFFYEAVINRDYNVIMFSALAGSFLSLIGYLVADIAYTLLDPRVSLD